jgi:glycosyltransferase involved in cell wall biosynthesis
MPTPVLFVFSHQRWNFVFGRSQQLLSRLAGRWHVVFVEEPVQAPGPARLEVSAPGPCLEVLVPHTPLPQAGFDDAQIAALLPLLRAHAQRGAGEVTVAWLTTPMALPLAEALRPACLVYDCVEELAARDAAPRALRRREHALLREAGLVLAAGPSLHESLRTRHANVHSLPSAVDAAHFAPERLDPASDEAVQAAALQGALAHPRLGFFGVIDERIDAGLVARLAEAHPDWQLVMAGPVVGIDPATLPRRPNLHWPGLQPYARLPHLLAGWDVALLPYVLNATTRRLCPAQTLEYMAGEKPVVSTAVPDVVALYGSVATIGQGAGGFVQACEAVLHETIERRCARALDMLTTVSTPSWARTADVVHRLVHAALQQRRAARTPAARPLLGGMGAAGQHA